MDANTEIQAREQWTIGPIDPYYLPNMHGLAVYETAGGEDFDVAFLLEPKQVEVSSRLHELAERIRSVPELEAEVERYRVALKAIARYNGCPSCGNQYSAIVAERALEGTREAG